VVYDRYAPALYRLLNAILGSSADAEDALQEVFVRLATARNPKIQDLRAYLFVAARHQALGMLRRRKRETPLDEAAWENVAGEDEPEAGHSQWTALLVRLPVEQREVIALKIWEQMTFAEIAEVVKASPNTVMSRYRYGIEKLRSWAEAGHE
jgi:RNA polymerase sigma-70 factor (ECF subfamily)